MRLARALPALLSAAAAASTLCAAGTAAAFTLNGSSALRGWNTNELVFHLNSANCPGNTEAMIDDALAMWNGVPTAAITLTRGETSDSLAEVAAGQSADVPAIFCLTDGVFSADVDSIPGFATGSHVSSNQNVDYGFLVLNVTSGRASIERLDEQLVKVVVAHEVGHVLGLGHSADTGALMYYDATAKTTASLAQDDVDGLTYLYPRDETSRDKLLGCGVAGGAARGGLGMGALAALLMAPCLLAARRWRRAGR